MQPHGLRPDSQGKVRDIYDLGDRLLLVATDRISAFDVLLSPSIPFKGEVLTRLSLFWFELLVGVVDNHLLSADTADLSARFAPHTQYLRGRSMLVRKASVFPVECIVRGYLAGSGWREYRRSGIVGGIELPAGLKESGRLDPPIFTPSTKAETGAHDECIDFSRMSEIVGLTHAEELRRLSIAVYAEAHEHAASRGVILADTKLEFGLAEGRVILVDEVLTPDSSRLWPTSDYEPGRVQASFDKQYVRDWLEASGWDKKTVPPKLPDDIVRNTSARYIQAYELITGHTFVPEGDG